MRYIFILFLIYSFVFQSQLALAEDNGSGNNENSVVEVSGKEDSLENLDILASLIELQGNLKKEIALSKKKLKKSNSETEKANLEKTLERLDKQLAETTNDFERIATGVEVALFAEKKPETFNWKDEFSSLVEPAIKELKRLTIRARQKTKLKDSISEYSKLSGTAEKAVKQLNDLVNTAEDKVIKQTLKGLLPEWRNIEDRLFNKLELAQLELAQLEDQEISFVESSSNSIRMFFRDRGLYLFLATITFFGILILCNVLSRILLSLRAERPEQLPLHFRILSLLYQGFSLVFAVFGLFFVLYLAEDWFLLSLAIIFLIAFVLTVRQGIPKLWQQGRLVLNIGSVREGERILFHGVPWQVEVLNVFCVLTNPVLGYKLRIPIEDMVGKVSRPYHPSESWFPCKKGDWVIINSMPRARIVSLSHETVELVERGGKRITYQTPDFLSQAPVNLSRNFRSRVVFGISYDQQAQATTVIPQTLKAFIERKLEDEGYAESCLNLLVEFKEANASSLDFIVIADFNGKVAEIQSRLERAIQRWCVEACTVNNWEIPFPQMTIHHPTNHNSSLAG